MSHPSLHIYSNKGDYWVIFARKIRKITNTNERKKGLRLASGIYLYKNAIIDLKVFRIYYITEDAYHLLGLALKKPWEAAIFEVAKEKQIDVEKAKNDFHMFIQELRKNHLIAEEVTE